MDPVIKSMLCLSGLRSRTARWQTHLFEDSALEMSRRLERVVDLCLLGDAAGMAAWTAFLPCIPKLSLEPEGYEVLRALHQSSEVSSLLRYLLLSPPPFRVFLGEVHGGVLRRGEVFQGKKGRERSEEELRGEISLGERKSVASGGDRRHLSMLLLDQDPKIIQRLCRNPRLTERDILVIATRRPTTREALESVASTPWIERYDIRRALALNPYNGTGASLRLLPLLRGRDRALLVQLGTVHALIRQMAKAMQERVVELGFVL